MSLFPNDGGPAFPPSNPHTGETGMTLRAYLAGQALIGIIANVYGKAGEWEEAATDACEAADALILKLNMPIKDQPSAKQLRLVRAMVEENNIPIVRLNLLLQEFNKDTLNDLTKRECEELINILLKNPTQEK